MSTEKRRVGILFETYEEEPVEPPPEKPANGKRPRRRKKRDKPDREEIFVALEKLGYEPSYQALDGRPQSLHAVARSGCDLLFNLAEAYDGDDTKDMNVAAYLDLIGIPYTGAGPHALYLAQDKALAKKIFHFHGIRTPFFATSYKGRLDHSHDISFPLIVKPSSEDGSIGIDSGSVVGSVKELMERIHYIHEEFDSPALIEEYIEGREIYVGVIGNEKLQSYTPWELVMSQLAEGAPNIATSRVKWDVEYQKKIGLDAGPARLGPQLKREFERLAKRIYRLLHLSGYARVDCRLTEDGRIYVLEVNPNPQIARNEDFADSAEHCGVRYEALLQKILTLGMSYDPMR